MNSCQTFNNLGSLNTWFNFEVYSPTFFIFFSVGSLLWVVCYIEIIRNIIKNQFVEMPILGVAVNIAWEFVWGIYFWCKVDLGLAFNLGYATWFFLDIFIFINLLKYGHKQLTLPSLKKHTKLICILVAICSVFAFIYFEKAGRDNASGAFSAYWDNLMFSAIYIPLILHMNNIKLFSYLVAWSKGLGTGIISVAIVISENYNPWLITICSVVFVIDMTYIAIFSKMRKKAAEQ